MGESTLKSIMMLDVFNQALQIFPASLNIARDLTFLPFLEKATPEISASQEISFTFDNQG